MENKTPVFKRLFLVSFLSFFGWWLAIFIEGIGSTLAGDSRYVVLLAYLVVASAGFVGVWRMRRWGFVIVFGISFLMGMLAAGEMINETWGLTISIIFLVTLVKLFGS